VLACKFGDRCTFLIAIVIIPGFRGWRAAPACTSRAFPRHPLLGGDGGSSGERHLLGPGWNRWQEPLGGDEVVKGLGRRAATDAVPWCVRSKL